MDWKNTLVKLDITIEEAIKILNGGVRILLVIDSNNRLQGTLTDGDIRRGLISKLPMDSKIVNLMNSNPITASSPYSREQVLNDMRKQGILHMPIIDNNGEICGLETLQNLIEKVTYDNPVFLMAGGFGSRLHPLTEKTPKPLLSVGNCPILETILKQFIHAGFHNFFISLFYKAEMIEEYFGDGAAWGVSIKYIHEDSPLGTAGSLGLLPDDMIDLPLIMMNGDLLTRVDFEQLLHFHNQSSAAATICVRQYDYEIPYGVVEVNNDLLVNINEKPLQKFLVNAGIYVLNQGLLDLIDGATPIDMPDFLCNGIGQEKVTVFPIHEYWLDIGHLREYERANKDIASLND